MERNFSLLGEDTSRFNVAATAVATRARKATTGTLAGRGRTELVSRMTYVFVKGSTHIDVPVYPVCPNEPTGSRAPRFEENGESMSQPRPRTSTALAGCCGVVIFS